MHKREKEKENEKEKERKSFETCLVLLFLAVSSLPILALLVGFQQHKLPPTSSLQQSQQQQEQKENQELKTKRNLLLST
jgi:cytoskeletal protein RodZ